MLPPLSLFSRCVCAVYELSLSLLSLSFFSLCVFYFILIWLFADQRVTRSVWLGEWVCPPPRPAKFSLQFAFCIWHLRFAICEFAFECCSRASYESFIHSMLLLLMMIQVSICIDLHFNCTFSTLYNGLFCSCINWMRTECLWMRCDLFMVAFQVHLLLLWCGK